MYRILIVSILIVPLLGCGGRKQGVVSGTVTYKGQPVNNVLLKLYPIPDGQPVTVPVNEKGEFRTTGVAAGEYKVVVESPQRQQGPAMPTNVDPAKEAQIKQKLQAMQKDQPAPPPYPDKYKNLVKTDLKCTITENQPVNLQLTD